MSSHLSSDDLAMFVLDELGAAGAARVEAHLVACSACSEALAAEARLEMALRQVADDSPTSLVAVRTAPETPARASEAPISRRRWAVVGAGALSLAAAWMLWVMPATRGSSGAAVSRSGALFPGHSSQVATDATPAGLDGQSADPLDGG